jgi:hypothetical protein
MQDDRPILVARISAEIFASTDLTEVCEWLMERQHDPVRVHANHLPAFGRGTRLRVARPITARRAVLCTLWLIEDADGGDCLVAGTLRFVSHPTASDVRLSFDGLMVPTSRGTETALQLLQLIESSIARNNGSQTEPISAAG